MRACTTSIIGSAILVSQTSEKAPKFNLPRRPTDIHVVQVIVGLGRHSVGGVARILPAVVRYLTEAGYNFKEEPNNAGES